jgi:glycosyltransferase involved in cell wall biosynthesis
MKNVLIVASALEIGGAERVIANLARHIDRDRFNVTICHLKERGVIGDELQQQGFRVLAVRHHDDPVRRYLSFLGLRKLVREQGIHLLHSHTTYALVDSGLCRMTTPDIRLVHTFHRGNYPDFNRRYMLMERVFSRRCDRLVAVGIEQEKKIRSAYNLAPGRVRTILNGVEDLRLTGDPEWAARLRADGRPVIGSISTLIEQKGITFLLDTAAELRSRGENPLFVVVGEGELRSPLEEKCRQLGLGESVVFTGWIPQAASRMLPLFDIFFQSSLWEAMSMVVLEAMAAGKPVVVTDVGDNRHVVEHDRTGFVVPPRDVKAMADALQGLIRSPERRRQYGQYGRARFEADYTAPQMARHYEEIYSELLDG